MCYVVFAKVNGDQTSFIECVIVLNKKKNKHFRFYVITPPPSPGECKACACTLRNHYSELS